MMFLVAISLIPFSTATTDTISQSYNGVTMTHMIEGIEFETSYAPTIDFDDWSITGNKAIEIKLTCENNPNMKTILVEHMHADIFIESNRSSFDDLTQDSMDDSFHGIQGGFFVSELYGYTEVFSIEGSSPEFQKTCGYVYQNYYGYTETKLKFSEANLIKECGVYGQSLYVVYDILIKSLGEDYFHKYIITDNLFISLDGTISNNVGNEQDTDDYVEGLPGYGIIFIACSTIGTLIFISAAIAKKREINEGY